MQKEKEIRKHFQEEQLDKEGIMKIQFKELKLINFKSHSDILVSFGERTDITGDNGEGKSTIPQSITWLLYNTDTFGSKLDPTPITYDSDETKVSLLLDVDGKQVLIERVLKKVNHNAMSMKYRQLQQNLITL